MMTQVKFAKVLSFCTYFPEDSVVVILLFYWSSSRCRSQTNHPKLIVKVGVFQNMVDGLHSQRPPQLPAPANTNIAPCLLITELLSHPSHALLLVSIVTFAWANHRTTALWGWSSPNRSHHRCPLAETCRHQTQTFCSLTTASSTSTTSLVCIKMFL